MAAEKGLTSVHGNGEYVGPMALADQIAQEMTCARAKKRLAALNLEWPLRLLRKKVCISEECGYGGWRASAVVQARSGAVYLIQAEGSWRNYLTDAQPRNKIECDVITASCEYPKDDNDARKLLYA